MVILLTINAIFDVNMANSDIITHTLFDRQDVFQYFLNFHGNVEPILLGCKVLHCTLHILQRILCRSFLHQGCFYAIMKLPP